MTMQDRHADIVRAPVARCRVCAERACGAHSGRSLRLRIQWGTSKSTREFKAAGAGKEHTSAVRGGGRDPGVRRPGSGLGRPTARSKFFHAACIVGVCVLLCFIINRYWGIVTVPVSIPYGSRPGVAGSSPFTLSGLESRPCHDERDSICF